MYVHVCVHVCVYVYVYVLVMLPLHCALSPPQRPPEHLAKDVLAEVPTQLVQYMALHEFPIGSPTAAAATAPRQP